MALSHLAGKDELQDLGSQGHVSEGHGDRLFQILIHPKFPRSITLVLLLPCSHGHQSMMNGILSSSYSQGEGAMSRPSRGCCSPQAEPRSGQPAEEPAGQLCPSGPVHPHWLHHSRPKPPVQGWLLCGGGQAGNVLLVLLVCQELWQRGGLKGILHGKSQKRVGMVLKATDKAALSSPWQAQQPRLVLGEAVPLQAVLSRCRREALTCRATLYSCKQTFSLKDFILLQPGRGTGTGSSLSWDRYLLPVLICAIFCMYMSSFFHMSLHM